MSRPGPPALLAGARPTFAFENSRAVLQDRTNPQIEARFVMTELLLVYGSLMPELLDAPFGRPQRQRLAAESTVVGRATVTGTLYDLGEHPAMLTPPAERGDTVHGTLLRLFDPAGTFAWLDEFEDVDPNGAETENGYLRERMTVSRDGQAQEAWVYVMRRVPPGSHRIPTGNWHAPSPKLGV